MIASMAAFAVEDALIKAASVSVSVSQILVYFGIGGAIIFTCIAIAKGEPIYSNAVISSPMRIRVVFEVTGRLFYFLSLSLIPLSAATVILQATPIVVVAAAALLFGEHVGWRRWFAIFLGMIGVIIIIQPGTESFSALSLIAVVGMLGFAGRDLASRAAPSSLSPTLLGLYGFLSVIVAGVLFSLWEGKQFGFPDADGAFYLACAIVTGIFAYTSLMKAMRTGEVSAVTPFRYTRLLFGVGLGVSIFGETMTMPMVIGCSLIVISGLFILLRGRQTASNS